ncbi:putative ECF RNA polymerase sigma factor SigI [Nocardioides dokdonensis FR1436]|uniref:Putative ECF RNA polymerase sigma factor SigI n=1 Tax=Nocardioides dokdonensis FR1436 TaxID=1300347 RepID=A0A1A9GH85_9ACTN|nr:putative ECF RNA polymerase sigma factor SigI [Nocardioides dokdonensis FR1436]
MEDDERVNAVSDAPLLDPDIDVDELGAHLRSLAYRMLGSPGEADRVVAEAWQRRQGAAPGSVLDERTWLSIVVARLSLQRLRSPVHDHAPAPDDEAVAVPLSEPQEPVDPFQEADAAALREAVDPDLLAALERLAPAERVAFVLHDLYDWHFEDVAGALGRTPVAARELAIRGRCAVQAGSDDEAAGAAAGARARQLDVVRAFVEAARGDDPAAMAAPLHPEVRLRADGAAIGLGAEAIVEGAPAVAAHLAEHVADLRPALLDGYAAAVWREDQAERMVVGFTVEDRLVLEIDLVADPGILPLLDLAPLDPRA